MVRLTNVRGVNLNLFDFDYDLTWSALMVNAKGRVYHRFGGRDAASPDTYLTLPGFKLALRAALAAHDPDALPDRPIDPPRRADDLPAAQRLKSSACIHCHHVYDFRRDAEIAAGRWTRDQVWVYPPPDNLGFKLDPQAGRRIAAIAANRAAEQAGLRPGDELVKLNGVPIASFADAQYALQRAPVEGWIDARVQRGEQTLDVRLPLRPGWRQTDISWRASMWNLEPSPCVYGPDLTAEEKAHLGLPPTALAFRQNQYLSRHVRQAGLRVGDIIVGIDGKRLEMTMLQFNAYVKLNYRTGDRITFNLMREGQRLDVPFTLPARP